MQVFLYRWNVARFIEKRNTLRKMSVHEQHYHRLLYELVSEGEEEEL